MFIFVSFDSVFSDSFLGGSYTCRCNYSVYDEGCTHSHLLHAHFSVAQFVCPHSHIFMRVTYTHAWLKCLKRFFAHVSSLSISPSPSHFWLKHLSIFCLLFVVSTSVLLFLNQ